MGPTVLLPFLAEHKWLQTNLSDLILGLGHQVWWTLGLKLAGLACADIRPGYAPLNIS